MAKTPKTKTAKVPSPAPAKSGSVSAKPEKKAKAKPAKSTRTGPWADPVKPAPLLVPAYVRQRKAAAATARTAMMVSVAVAVLIAAVAGWSWWNLTTAEQDLAQQKSVEQDAKDRVAALQPVADYYDGLVARQESMFTQLRGEIDYGLLLGSLMAGVPDGVRIGSLSVSDTGPCPGPDPFAAPASYGCVSFTLSSNSATDVIAFVEDLNTGMVKPEGLWHSAFTASSLAGAPEPGGQSTFAVTVNYTERALSLTHVPVGRHDEVLADARAQSSSPSTTGTSPTGTTVPAPVPAPGGTP